MAERVDLEIARLIGQPIDPNLKVPVALAEIANIESAEAGELVRIFNNSAEDVNNDDIYAVDADGGLTLHKISPVAPATLTFSGLSSKLEYVLLDEVLPAPDQKALGRKKAGIARAMDKEELRRILAAILGGLGSQEVSALGKLYTGILALKHKVEDYGDNFILLVSPDVSEAIDTYEIDNVTTYNYKMGLRELLETLAIKTVKVVGKVNGANLMTAKTGILVARDSSLAAGKPITFVRRAISAEVATQMGIEAGERIISVAQVPTIINAAGKNTLGYGTFGYESIIETIVNFRAISWSQDLIA